MSDAHIHAYVDGQLKRERGISLQSILGDLPEKYEQLEEYQRINDSLRTTLQPMLDEPIPNSIMQLFNGAAPSPAAANSKFRKNKPNHVESQTQPEATMQASTSAPDLKSEAKATAKKQKVPKGEGNQEMENEFDYKYKQLRSFGSALRTIPIIVILCIVSFIVGWNVRNQYKFNEERTAEFVNQAINSDNIFIGNPQEITEPRSLDRIFRKKFTRPLQIPDSKELSLKGGRILPYGQSGTAALLEYSASGHAVSLYFNQVPGLVTVEIPFCENVKPKMVCYWHRGDMNFAVTATLKETQLRGIAKTFLQQLLHSPGEI